jgi:hypothetical protein
MTTALVIVLLGAIGLAGVVIAGGSILLAVRQHRAETCQWYTQVEPSVYQKRLREHELANRGLGEAPTSYICPPWLQNPRTGRN